MFRFLLFLVLVFLLYKILSFFLRLYLFYPKLKRTTREKNEIIDIDYEEVKEDKKSNE